MKPRLISAPLTEEDLKIMCRTHAPGFRRHAFDRGRALDRRDAELMLGLQSLRAQGDCFLRLKIGVHWCNVIVPAIHVYVRKNPLWPAP